MFSSRYKYQGDLRQGQGRLFVLWTRIRTPSGVVVDLDSPAADPLGGSGVPGEVDTHFWPRFGGAILLSVIHDGLAAGANAAGGRGDNTYNFGNTSGTAQDMASEALRNSINIPPTLTKNQGDRVGIFVARDFDFGGVYALRAD